RVAVRRDDLLLPGVPAAPRRPRGEPRRERPHRARLRGRRLVHRRRAQHGRAPLLRPTPARDHGAHLTDPTIVLLPALNALPPSVAPEPPRPTGWMALEVQPGATGSPLVAVPSRANA